MVMLMVLTLLIMILVLIVIPIRVLFYVRTYADVCVYVNPIGLYDIDDHIVND